MQHWVRSQNEFALTPQCYCTLPAVHKLSSHIMHCSGKQPLMEIQTLTIFSATSKRTQLRHWNVHAFLGTQKHAITQSPDPVVQWAVDYCRLTKSINLQCLHVSSVLHSPVKPKQRSLWSFYLLTQVIIHVSIKFKPKHLLYAFIVYSKCLEIN